MPGLIQRGQRMPGDRDLGAVKRKARKRKRGMVHENDVATRGGGKDRKGKAVQAWLRSRSGLAKVGVGFNPRKTWNHMSLRRVSDA